MTTKNNIVDRAISFGKRVALGILIAVLIIAASLFPDRLAVTVDTESDMFESRKRRAMQRNHCAAEGFELPYTLATSTVHAYWAAGNPPWAEENA